MHLLAIETATETCSAALLIGDRLLVRSEFAPRRHAELLLPMCESLLAEAGIGRRDLDALAFGCGPGAFTGVRLAVSAAQGIALALDLPVVPVSSLAALAMQAPRNDAPILALIDARMGEIYAGHFRRDAAGLVVATAAESVGAAAALALPIIACNIVGSGWTSDRAAIESRLEVAAAWAEGDRYPQADAVALLAAPRVRAGDVLAADLALPVYLRDKVALTLLEQRASKRAPG